MSDRGLPALSAVRVFEAAARHLSFTRAAEELGMTQAAVSYQIKLLEERLGAALFLRRPRALALTDTGRILAPRLSEAFEIMRSAFAGVDAQEQGTLNISVLHTVASQWLAPRLGKFHLQFPHLAVRVDTTSHLVDFSREQVDIGIRSGTGHWPGLTAHFVLAADFAPMLSPGLAARYPELTRPADLLKLPLLEPDDVWWRMWFDLVGMPADTLRGRTEASFGTQALLSRAAMADQGVAILSVSLFREELRSGRLIQPFPEAVSCDQNYWMVYPEGRRNAPKIRNFRDWMLAELSAG
jgi:LysR family glycine cleavage system transcriptional activator